MKPKYQKHLTTNEIIISKHEFIRFVPPPHCPLACEDPLHALCKTIKDI